MGIAFVQELGTVTSEDPAPGFVVDLVLSADVDVDDWVLVYVATMDDAAGAVSVYDDDGICEGVEGSGVLLQAGVSNGSIKNAQIFAGRATEPMPAGSILHIDIGSGSRAVAITAAEFTGFIGTPGAANHVGSDSVVNGAPSISGARTPTTGETLAVGCHWWRSFSGTYTNAANGFAMLTVASASGGIFSVAAKVLAAWKVISDDGSHTFNGSLSLNTRPWESTMAFLVDVPVTRPPSVFASGPPRDVLLGTPAHVIADPKGRSV